MHYTMYLFFFLQTLASKRAHGSPSWRILQHPYSIAVDDQYVYWDDWQTGKVYKIHKSFKGTPVTLIEKTPGLSAKSRYEIKVYYSRSQVGKPLLCSCRRLFHMYINISHVIGTVFTNIG